MADSISRTISAGPAQAARRPEARSAVAVMSGARAATLRAVKTGAMARRCQRHWAPSEVKRLAPTAERSMRIMISDFG
ncbi:MAG: hypothetical protein R3D28_11900 [Geminicoccaceae bacterium]|nr:hypothetical protein [Geminicoccaceae bacterium]